MGNDEGKDTAAPTESGEGWLVVMVIMFVGASVLAVMLFLVGEYGPEPPAAPTPPGATHQGKELWDGLPLAPAADVEAFAITFLQTLGYTLAGGVSCPTWEVDLLSRKRYRCYAVYNPASAPMRLNCGPALFGALTPMSCIIDTP